MTAIEEPKIISDPVGTVTFEGNDNGAKFSCNASVQEGSVYSWYYSQYGSGNWEIFSSSSNELIVGNPLESAEGWYRCQITSDGATFVSGKAHLNILHTSISELRQEVSFKISTDALTITDVEIRTSISDQLNGILQPMFAEIDVTNDTSIAEDGLHVVLQIRARYEYVPSMQLSVQATEAFQYKQSLLQTVNDLEAKITSSQLILVLGGDLLKAVTNSLVIGETQYICPPGSGLQFNKFLCSK